MNENLKIDEVISEIESELGLFEEPKVEVKTEPKAKKEKKVKKVEVEAINTVENTVDTIEVKVEEPKVEKPKKEKVKKEAKAKVEKAPKEPKPKKSKAITHEFVETSETSDERLFELTVTDKQGNPSPRWRVFMIKSPVGYQLGVVERKTNGKLNADGTAQRVRCEYMADGIEDGKPIFTELQLKEIPRYVFSMAIAYVQLHQDKLAN